MDIETTRGTFEVIDAGKGTPVVFVHGFPFAAESWEADAAALAPDMRVLAPSMRGFGRSQPADDSLSIDGMADDVAAVLDGVGLREPVVMGGLSMGGYVAMAFARRHAARVRALVLADTRAEPDSDEARSNRDKGIAVVTRGDLAGFVDGLLEKLVSPWTREHRPDVIDVVRGMMMAAPPDSVVHALRALRDRPDARPGLRSVKVPTLVVVGADDALMPPSVADVIARGIEGAKTVVIPRAGHLSNLEQPVAFRDAVRAFVAGLGRAA